MDAPDEGLNMDKLKYEVGGVEWKRRSFVTQGADPTEVVSWTRTTDRLTITEFQNVYTQSEPTELTDVEAEKVHKTLEDAWFFNQYFTREETLDEPRF